MIILHIYYRGTITTFSYTYRLAFFDSAFIVGHVQRSVSAVFGSTCSRCRRRNVSISIAAHSVLAFENVRYGKRSEILVFGHSCGGGSYLCAVHRCCYTAVVIRNIIIVFVCTVRRQSFSVLVLYKRTCNKRSTTIEKSRRVQQITISMT